MGYCISLRDSSFEIKKSKMSGTAKAIRALANGRKYSWVEPGFSKLRSIEELFYAWGFDCERTRDGVIDCIGWEGEKSGDEEVLFAAIAPFVTKGSFLEWHGEDGKMWRFVFDGKTMKIVEAKIVWE